jgi:cytochrome d ubiquinol oxidase subunit II
MGLPEATAAVMMLSLNAYALMGGADFGGGVWDLLASGPRKDEQRALVARAIGPIWEANHVWLIVAVVVLFTSFPTVFAIIGTALHIPLTLMLVGIVLRGSAFAFRTYGSVGTSTGGPWERVFALSSVITPFFLGVIVGTLASGAVGERMVGGELRLGDSFATVFIAPWAAPFPAAVGVMAVALFAFLAAVYLALEARDDALRNDFRQRALGAALAVFVSAFGALAVSYWEAPRVRWGLTVSAWAVAFHVATGASAVTAVIALWHRRWSLARFAAAAQVSLILWGWALSQYPYLIPQALTIRDAASPRATLALLVWALVAGALVLLPSLIYLFRTFSSAPTRQT